MGAYIIHFDDKPWQDLDDEQYYRCKEIPWFSTTKTTISRLTPYTEDSAYAHGYTEAESKYRKIRDELEKQAYQKGLKDAWDAARTLWNTPNRKEIFGHTAFNTVLTTLTAQETIEKIRQYEQEQKQLHVGDEVNAPFGKAIVVNIDSVAEKIRLVYADGHGGFEYFKDAPTKTGRHFPEIAAVLEKMRGEQNG